MSEKTEKIVEGMKNFPERIYLQIGEDCPEDADFNELVGVTHSTNRINDNDIEYVRAEGKPEQSDGVEMPEHILEKAKKYIGNTYKWDFQMSALEGAEYGYSLAANRIKELEANLEVDEMSLRDRLILIEAQTKQIEALTAENTRLKEIAKEQYDLREAIKQAENYDPRNLSPDSPETEKK